MIDADLKPKDGLNLGRILKCGFLLTIVLLTLLVVSCGVIPGGKECDTVVGSFMRAAAAKDVDSAYGLFCEKAKVTVMREDIEGLILGNYELFEGYDRVKMRGINVHYSEEGDTAEYNGAAEYARDFTAWVEAELVKEGDEWKLWGIWITPSE